MKTARNMQLLKRLSGSVIAIAALFCAAALHAQTVTATITGRPPSPDNGRSAETEFCKDQRNLSSRLSRHRCRYCAQPHPLRRPVNVSEAAPILNTDDPTLSSTFTANTIQNFPLNGLDFSALTLYALTLYVPGSVSTVGTSGTTSIERST